MKPCASSLAQEATRELIRVSLFNLILPWVSLVLVVVLYLHQAFIQGGNDYVSFDGKQYLSLLNGDPPGWPKNVRLLQPGLAWVVSRITGLSHADSFRVLTPLEFLLSVLLIWHLLRRRETPVLWQATSILVLGCPTAVLFGHAPVLVDPLLLLVSCAMIVSLDHGRLGLALLLACLAVLTKECGLVLAVLWGVGAYRAGFRKAAIAGFLLPCALSVTLKVVVPQGHIPNWSQGERLFGMEWFIRGALSYQFSQLSELGPIIYLKTVYIWLWGLGWPFFLLALEGVIQSLAVRNPLDTDLRRFLVLFLVSWPFVFMTDSDRAILFVVPFACLAAATHPLARRQYFVGLLALGATATAFARPAYFLLSPPRWLTLAMIGVSLAASGLLLGSLAMYWFGVWRTDLSPTRNAPELGAM